MKKKAYDRTFNLQERLKKKFILLICTLFWSTMGISNVLGEIKVDQDSVVFKDKQMTVEAAFDAITKQLKYDVFYSESELDVHRMIQVPRLKMGLAELLNFILKTEFIYEIKNRIIIISPKRKENSEQREIRGIVKDEDQLPLPGVTILVKGTTIGLSTNAKGEFHFPAPSNVKDLRLLFSFVGMETQEVEVKSDFLSITMKMSVNQMDEVIVRTGFENIDKRKLTSSVVTVKMDDIMEPITTTLDKMLQGKIPGMAVLQQSSTVGAAPKIRIRGSSTIVGSREPLWVLDGIVLEDPVPLSPEELNSMDQVNLIGNAISGINPEDIEQIDVLKDASATALYGSKAANGVIMITTKKGKIGKPAIRYSMSLGFTHRPMTSQMHVMNSKDRVEVSEEMVEKGLQFVNSGITGSVGYEGLLFQLYGNKISYTQFQKEVKKMKEQNTDWFKYLFRNALSHNHTLSVSGANETINYYFSVGYSSERGSSLKEDSERFNFNTNLDIKINDKMNASFGLSASNGTTHRPGVDLFQYAYTTSRAIAPYDEDGYYNFYEVGAGYQNDPYRTPDLVYNIFNELNTTGEKSQLLTLNTRFSFSYKVASCLSLNALLAYNISSYSNENIAAEDSYQVSELRGLVYGYPIIDPVKEPNFARRCALPFGGKLDNSDNRNTGYSARVTASFQKTLHERHDFSLMGGLDMRSTHQEGHTSSLLGYLPERGKKSVDIDPGVWISYGDLLKSSRPTITDSKKNEVSYFASFSYSYDNRYIFNANVRGDASNKLGQDKSARFLPIWSISGRWNIADENFMENVTWIQGLNIHGSYGLQGNVTEAHNPNMVANVGALDAISHYYESTVHSLPNRGLRWEKTRSVNIGTDFSFFNRRLSATFEYYNKKGKDQLVSTTIESTNGGTAVTINDGNLINSGWDLSISATPIQLEKFSWNLSFNTSKSYNKVTNSGEMDKYIVSQYLNGSLVRNGRSLNSFYSYRFGGLNEKGELTFLGIYAKDEEGNVIISSQEEALASALVYSGRREPLFSGGLSTSFRIFDFSLNASFSMQFGSKMRLNDLYVDGNRLPAPNANMSDEFVDRWRKPGDEKYTDIPRLTDERHTPQGLYYHNGGAATIGDDIFEFYNNSDLRVVSGNFVRCRSISLAYYVPNSILKHIYLKGASLSFSVSNPFVIKAKGLKGRDPEQVTLGSGSIPPQKNFSFSLNVTF